MAYAKKKKSVDTGGEKLTFLGKVREVRFYSDDSSWGFIKVEVDETVPFSIKEMDYNFETNQTDSKWVSNVVGKMPKPEIGMLYEIEGVHKYNEKYRSDQWEVINIGSTAPKTVEHQIDYLKALVTEKQARTILEQYPNIVDDVIKGVDNVDIDLLKGIGQETWDKIKDKIVENFAIGDILALLIPIGISLNKVRKLLDGEKNVEILKKKLIENPYVLTSIDGISFTTADKIAVQLNPDLKVSEERLVAFIRHHLNEIGESSGDTWVEKSEIKDSVIKNVPECEKFLDSFLEKENENPSLLFLDSNKIYLKKNYDSEVFIWKKVQEMIASDPILISQEDVELGISEAENEQGFVYTEQQKNTIINMTKNNFVLIGGRAGVGKSVTARGLLKIYARAGYTVITSAFSAKAAVRAQEATGFAGGTLHRLLGIGRGSDSPFSLGEAVVFVDECAMNPLYLMRKLFESVKTGSTKLILSGDSRQLPAIGLGNVFSDLLEKDSVNANILTEIQRQAADSGIINDANLIRDGISPVDNFYGKKITGNKKDLYYIFNNSKEDLFRIAVSTFVKSSLEKGVGNVVLLVPFRGKVLNSTREFNRVIQKELNSENSENKFVFGDKSFWLNDFVIHCVNNYDKKIFNGFTGFVSLVEKDRILVNYDGNEIEYTREDIKELDLAYALTPWKYQGSETKDVIVVMDSSHYILLSSQYLYSAMTRAKERALVLSDSFAFSRCLQEDKTIRKTFLKEII